MSPNTGMPTRSKPRTTSHEPACDLDGGQPQRAVRQALRLS
jgi:hypothetical protein